MFFSFFQWGYNRCELNFWMYNQSIRSCDLGDASNWQSCWIQALMICDVSAGSSKKISANFGQRWSLAIRLVKKFLSGYSKFPVHAGIRPWRWPLKIDRLTSPIDPKLGPNYTWIPLAAGAWVNIKSLAWICPTAQSLLMALMNPIQHYSLTNNLNNPDAARSAELVQRPRQMNPLNLLQLRSKQINKPQIKSGSPSTLCISKESTKKHYSRGICDPSTQIDPFRLTTTCQVSNTLRSLWSIFLQITERGKLKKSSTHPRRKTSTRGSPATTPTVE